MTIDKIKTAKKLVQRDLTPTVIARRIGLSVSTLYRYLPGDVDKSCASAEAQASGNNLSAVRFAAGNYARFRPALMH
jgi:hypothetical protein